MKWILSLVAFVILSQSAVAQNAPVITDAYPEAYTDGNGKDCLGIRIKASLALPNPNGVGSWQISVGTVEGSLSGQPSSHNGLTMGSGNYKAAATVTVDFLFKCAWFDSMNNTIWWLPDDTFEVIVIAMYGPVGGLTTVSSNEFYFTYCYMQPLTLILHVNDDKDKIKELEDRLSKVEAAISWKTTEPKAKVIACNCSSGGPCACGENCKCLTPAGLPIQYTFNGIPHTFINGSYHPYGKVSTAPPLMAASPPMRVSYPMLYSTGTTCVNGRCGR